MDLTTRRGDMDGTLPGPGNAVFKMNGTEQVCRELVNGTETGDVTAVAEVTTPRKTNSFSIRNLVGGEDSERSTDGTANTSDGKCNNSFT